MARSVWADRLQILRTVAVAAVIAFGLELLITRPNLRGVLTLALAYPILLALFFLVGRWLGLRTWPRRGGRLARSMLKRWIRDEHASLYLSDRPDGEHPTARRVWEVIGFSVGASLLISGVLVIAGAQGGIQRTSALLLPLVTLWGSFLLAPYWLYSRMGLRHVDARRWLILPASRRYADRLKLSNGALLLLALGVQFNALWRAGAAGPDALVGAIITAVNIMAGVLVIAATAVAYYTAEERRLVLEIETDALAMGVQDARGMDDNEFLPSLPKRAEPRTTPR